VGAEVLPESDAVVEAGSKRAEASSHAARTCKVVCDWNQTRVWVLLSLTVIDIRISEEAAVVALWSTMIRKADSRSDHKRN
jgi:hypothetical protein